jgi:hypothetical protein
MLKEESASNLNYLKWKFLLWDYSERSHKMEMILGKCPNREQYGGITSQQPLCGAWKKYPTFPQVRAFLGAYVSTFPFWKSRNHIIKEEQRKVF